MKIVNWHSCTLKNQCAQIKLNRRTMLWWSDLNLNQILGRVSTKIKYEANLMDIAKENCAVNMSVEYFCNFLGFSLFIYNHCFNNKSNKKLSKEGGAKRWANSSCEDVIIVRRPGPSTELPCSKEAARAMMRLFALCLLFTSWQWFCPAVHPASLLKQQLQKAWSVWRRMFMAQFSNELSLSSSGRSCSANCARGRLIGSMGMECAWQWV